jgi:putative peptidoglycan lipid II flippase
MPMNKPQTITGSGAARATVIVMIALILSKMTGQIREMLIPSRIGFGMLSDAYILGFMVPDLVYQLLVGGSIQAAITPTLSGAIRNGNEKKVWRSVSIFINMTALIMLGAVMIGELVIPVVLPLFSGDKSRETVDLAISVSRMLFPQVFFMMLAALSIGVLNAYKKFTAASMGPVVYNLCVVAAMLVFGNKTADGVRYVALGVLISAGIYFSLQFLFARNQFRHFTLSFDWENKGFRRLVRLAIPTLISASIVQINLIILSGFTNFYDDGSLTSLRFAITTWQLPYGVFAVAVGGVMLPTLAGNYAIRDFKAFSTMLTKAVRSTLFLIIPSAVVFAMQSREVIRGIFEWGSGHLAEESITLTAAMLSWYCIAMVCHSLIFLMNMSFYAVGKTGIPLLNGVITLVTNTLFCLVLTRFSPFGVLSMPMAYALSSIISAVLLFVLFRRNFADCAPRKIPQFLLKSAFCAGSAALFLWVVGSFGWDSANKVTQLGILAVKALAGMAGYFLMAFFLQMKEPADVFSKLGRILARFR